MKKYFFKGELTLILLDLKTIDHRIQGKIK